MPQIRFFGCSLCFFGTCFVGVIAVVGLLVCAGRTAADERTDESGDVLERLPRWLAHSLALQLERPHFAEESRQRAAHSLHILGSRQFGKVAVVGHCHRLAVLCSHLTQVF